MYELSLLTVSLLLVTGFLAGMINVLAGGGSNLTLPALMVMGLPADIANATNRVSIFLQSVTAVTGFHKHGKLDMPDLRKILGVTVVGGLFGALTASYMPQGLLKPVLLSAMVIMAGIILFKPSVVAPPEGTPPRGLTDSPSSIPLLLLAGFYGGFVQAGVGFILIAAIAGGLRYDLVRTNALKVACSLAFTAIALLVFIANDQILWVPGLILALGSIVGAHMAVKITINLSHKALKWILFVMTIIASGFALFS